MFFPFKSPLNIVPLSFAMKEFFLFVPETHTGRYPFSKAISFFCCIVKYFFLNLIPITSVNYFFIKSIIFITGYIAKSIGIIQLTIAKNTDLRNGVLAPLLITLE